jgi:hypothetical protein
MEPDQFTLDEANSLIPWLAEKFRKLNMLRQEYVVAQTRLGDIQLTSDKGIDDAGLRAVSEQLAWQIDQGVEEILDQGIIVRDVSRGLVDFPSLRDNQDIYLCWIGGEEQIEYWHETDRGFSHRQPI